MSKREPNRCSSLEERAYQEIREMIIRGELKPGAQIVQEDLAVRLGLSRTPLRRALADLAKENFVEIAPRGAAYVRQFDAEELCRIFEIRAVLEGLACRLVAPTIQAKHIAYLRSLITDAALASTPDDDVKYREADTEFHTYLTDLADDPVLSQVLESYQILSLSFTQGLLRSPDETLQEHLDILDALAKHDSDAAEELMRTHIRRSLDRFREKS